MSDNFEIPDTFWPLFINKLRVLGEIYNPVTVERLYPFIVSHLPAKMAESVLMRAVERGLVAIDVQEIKKDVGPPTVYRTVREVSRDNL